MHAHPAQQPSHGTFFSWPQTRIKCEGSGAPRGPTGETLGDTVSIVRLLDMEENVWSPQYGLKGKMDVSVVAKVRFAPDARPSPCLADAPPLLSSQVRHDSKTGRAADVCVLPIELKTGNVVTATAHRAQVTYYGLLMTDRYGPCGGPDKCARRTSGHPRPQLRSLASSCAAPS